MRGYWLVSGLVCAAEVGCSRDDSPLPTARDASSDPSRILQELNDTEEVVESFAQHLIGWATNMQAQGGPSALRAFAPSILATPFPTVSSDLEPLIKWIQRHDWVLPKGPRRLAAEELARSLDGFLEHMSVVEDVRLKVTSAALERTTQSLRGVLAMELVGRDRDSRREWVRGSAHFSARRDAKSDWKIDEFGIDRLESLVAVREVFSEVSKPAGLVATYTIGSVDAVAGHGAAAADADGDGLIDLYFTDATARTGNRLYLNRGDGTFKSFALAPMAAPGNATTGALFVDYDNDGDSDLFVSCYGGPQRLFQNQLVPSGKLGFRDVSERSGVAVLGSGYSAVAGDLNRDGFPDIYVTGYKEVASPEAAAAKADSAPEQFHGLFLNSFTRATNGAPDLLFLSRGDGTFQESAAAWGVADSRFSLAAELVDLDGDDRLDLVLANDFGGGSTIYRNEGDRFVDVGAERGLLDHRNGMGVSVADYDNDGDLDIHITNMSSVAGKRIFAHLDGSPSLSGLERARDMTVGNVLYQNIGGGRYKSVDAFPAGWAWGGGFVDVDNDGWLDLHSPNGFISGASKADT